MKTTTKLPFTSPVAAPSACWDVSRGAVRAGIGARVQLDATMLDDYLEPDHALGFNSTGVVLSAFSTHLKEGRFDADEPLVVCLARREDGTLVDVEISIHRFRAAGTECFRLKKAGERASV